MKKFTYLLSTLALVLVLNGNALGQIEVDASAEVLANISEESKRAVNFGDIQPDLNPTPTLTPSNNITSGVSGDNVQFGYVVFSGTSGQSVSVSFKGGESQADSEEILSNGTDDITFNVNVTESPGDGSSGTPAGNNLTSGSPITLSDGSGVHTLWIGGTLEKDGENNISSGTYQGTIVFNFDYSF